MIYSNMCISALQDCSQMAVLHPCARRRLEMQIIQRARESRRSFVSAKQPTEEVFAVCVSNLQKKHLKGGFDTDITIFFFLNQGNSCRLCTINVTILKQETDQAFRNSKTQMIKSFKLNLNYLSQLGISDSRSRGQVFKPRTVYVFTVKERPTTIFFKTRCLPVVPGYLKAELGNGQNIKLSGPYSVEPAPSPGLILLGSSRFLGGGTILY